MRMTPPSFAPPPIFLPPVRKVRQRLSEKSGWRARSPVPSMKKTFKNRIIIGIFALHFSRTYEYGCEKNTANRRKCGRILVKSGRNRFISNWK
ncbi:hypothetical protein [Zongyangia hominis]|uniref:Uncharacterized protein n=1 Tax=Zongyangia hominis TaxID=2763677 RepID=A0A926EC08_9FIRM|nr:hypothetical protein [Zongyangia hominis]MBC8571117.1 hypothetical protein [Zongyangia hominis]